MHENHASIVALHRLKTFFKKSADTFASIQYIIIRKYEKSGYVGDKPRSTRPKNLSRGQLTRLKRLFNKRTGISLRRLAPRFKVSYQTVSNHLKVMGIRYYKKKRAPKYTDKQHEEVPTRAQRLFRMLSNNDFELIMDDEK